MKKISLSPLYILEKMQYVLHSESSKIQLIRSKEVNHILEELKLSLEISSGCSLSISQNKIISVHLWHIFSYNYLKCYEKVSAIQQFSKQLFKDYIILTSNPKFFSIKLYNESFVENKIFKLFSIYDIHLFDVYITDSNYEWIFIIPHEEDIGPYYYKL